MDTSVDIKNIILDKVYRKIDINTVPDDGELSDIIDEVIMDNCSNDLISVEEKIRYKSSILNSIRGLDVISELLEDEEITEIMVNGYDNIFIEKNGKLFKTDKKFSSEKRLFEIIQRIMSGTNRVVNETSPIVDTRLEDGSRVNIVLHPISLRGSSISIRKFPKDTMTLSKLIEYKSINEQVASFLKYIVKIKKNIFISGGTSSGKTSMLNALSKMIPSDERIITIEDSAELCLDNIENLVSLEVRNANLEGENAISMRELIKTALRMRPNRIIVGEVRGEETIEMLQAMNTGHSGSISTGHSNSCRDMISRLETMVLMAMDIPISAVRKQIASAIDIFIHLGKDNQGKRSMVEITEVRGIRNGDIVLEKLFERKEDKFIKVSEMKNIKEYD